jgi:hypothetical protein
MFGIDFRRALLSYVGGPDLSRNVAQIETFGSLSIVFYEAMHFGSVRKTERWTIRRILRRET